MTNSTQAGGEDNRNIVVLVSNGQQRPIDLRMLSEPSYADQVRSLCASCPQITVLDWQKVATSPNEASQVFLSLWRLPSIDWRFQVAGRQELFTNPFDALLHATIDRSDLTAVGRATNFAIALAAQGCPAAATEAGSRIRLWLSHNGVNGEPARSIAAQIRRINQSTTPNQRLSPQDGARRVLEWFQEAREAHGEQDRNSSPVRFYQDEWYVWDGTQWILCPTSEYQVVQILQQVLDSTDLTNNFIRSVLTNLKGLTFVDTGTRRPPYFITGIHELHIHERQVIGTENCVIDLSTIGTAANQLVVHPVSPSYFALPRLNYRYDCNASCQLWLQTITEILAPISPGDHRIEILQEFFGYCLLSANHRFETFLILIGDGSNGKSVILEVLTETLGKQNVSQVALDAFGGEFRNAEMIGKLANIATDMQRMPRVHEGILKQLVSGEPIQINRKHKPAMSMYPTAKLVFATNHLPPFSDTSDGLWRRMLVVPFFVQFTETMIDRYRARRIVAQELSGVLNWALEGARRLIRNDAFTRCQVCETAKYGHRHDSDPFLQFLDECCETGEGLSVLADDLYVAYRGFCEHIKKMPKAKPELGKQLAKIAGVTRDREGSRRRYYIYRGIHLLPTVLANLAKDRLTMQYQPPRQEHYPSANRSGRPPSAASAQSSSPGVPAPPPRGMSPETT